MRQSKIIYCSKNCTTKQLHTLRRTIYRQIALLVHTRLVYSDIWENAESFSCFGPRERERERARERAGYPPLRIVCACVKLRFSLEL